MISYYFSGTCLQHAVKEGKGTILDFLLKQEGIDVNQVTDKEPCPPIFLACQNIDKDCFAKLVSSRANIYGIKANGKNILHYLINSKYDAEKTLDFTKLKIMHQIIERICNVNHADKVLILINEPDELKKTPLHYATLLPGQSIVKLLLANGGERSLFKKDVDLLIPINLIDKETVREFLDQKISWKGPFYHKNFEASYNLDFLVPIVKDPSSEDTEMLVDEVGYPIHEKQVFELEHLAMMEHNHLDLYDHPLFASMIL